MKLQTSGAEETLYCFSPAVMLFTFLFEFTSAIYILLTGKFKPSAIVITLILICLGVFQLAEFQVCSQSSLIWMRVGYIAITLLPPLGVHLVSLVSKKARFRLISYSLAAIFILSFIIHSETINSAVCGGNYVMIATASNLISYSFPIYYYLLLMIGLFDISWSIRWQKNVSGYDKEKISYFFWLGLGYASFLIPTGAVYFLSQAARSGIPSVMCGFAVFLALILTFKLYPLSRKLGI